MIKQKNSFHHFVWFWSGHLRLLVLDVLLLGHMSHDKIPRILPLYRLNSIGMLIMVYCNPQKAGISYPIWVFPKIVVPQNGWFIMENPIKMDDLGVPLFLETPIFIYHSFIAHMLCYSFSRTPNTSLGSAA